MYYNPQFQENEDSFKWIYGKIIHRFSVCPETHETSQRYQCIYSLYGGTEELCEISLLVCKLNPITATCLHLSVSRQIFTYDLMFPNCAKEKNKSVQVLCVVSTEYRPKDVGLIWLYDDFRSCSNVCQIKQRSHDPATWKTGDKLYPYLILLEPFPEHFWFSIFDTEVIFRINKWEESQLKMQLAMKC